MTTLRIIIIGAGLIGPRHAQSVLSHPSTDLIAFIDPSPSALPIAQSFSVPLYPSLQEFLSKHEKPDAAIVCTPNHTHVPITLDLLHSGIRNILLEKPISDSIASAEKLLDALSNHIPENDNTRTNTNILIGHHRRFNPYALTAKSLLASETLGIGTILALNGLWTLLKPPSYFKGTGVWRAGKRSGGVLGINLIHDIDVLHFLFGPVVRVFAEGTALQRGRGENNVNNVQHTAEEGCAITLRFGSGVVGTFLVCDAVAAPWNFEMGTGENPNIPVPAPGASASTSAGAGAELEKNEGDRDRDGGGVDCYRIFGTRGSLSFPDLTRWSYDGVQENEKEKGWNCPLSMEKIPVEGKDVKPFDRQWEHFVRVCYGEEEVACTVEDGVRALKVVRAIKESMETGKPVEVDGSLLQTDV